MAKNIRHFPYRLILKAYNILETRGKKEFDSYVNTVHMPTEDIERVLNKYKYKRDPEFRTKVKGLAVGVEQKLDGSDLDLDNLPF